MAPLTSNQIDESLRVYRDELPYDDQEEHELIEAIQTQNHVSADQLERIIRWKLEGQGGRPERYVGMMRKIPSEAVEYISRAAFITQDPENQLKILNGIPGVGYATATVILAFHNPDDYAVGDRIINEELLQDETYVTPQNYVNLLAELKKLRPDGYTLRETEKALYIRPYLD